MSLEQFRLGTMLGKVKLHGKAAVGLCDVHHDCSEMHKRRKFCLSQKGLAELAGSIAPTS